jgi:hypothetical protein
MLDKELVKGILTRGNNGIPLMSIIIVCALPD